MATTALAIISRALRILRVLDRNQPLQADDRNDALEAFNQVILHLQTTYNNLWTMTQAVVLMEQGKQFYKCGVNGDRVVNRDDLRNQTLASAAITGATSLTISSAVNVLLGDKVGVYLSTGSFHWTTASAASTGTTITIANALPSDAATGAAVYVYTSTIERPLRVLNAQSAWAITDSEIPLDEWGRGEYFNQPDKSTQGQTSNFYYSPQLTAGELYVWPTAQSNLNVLRMTYIRPIITAIQNIDAPDFPNEWQETLAYMTAEAMMDEYGLPQDRQATIKAKASELLFANLSFDNDSEDIAVEPTRW